MPQLVKRNLPDLIISPPPERYALLDILRMIAALWVFFFHFARHQPPFEGEFLQIIAHTGAWGVSLFFILSGFVLMRSYGHLFSNSLFKRDVWFFWKRRFKRIAPIYYAVFTLFLILYGVILSEKVSIRSVFFQLLFIQSWESDLALDLNFPAWSISCELFFYFLYPFLAFTIQYIERTQFNNLRKIATLLVFFLPFLTILKIEPFLGLYHPLTNLPLFICGMILARITKALPFLFILSCIQIMLLNKLRLPENKDILVNGYLLSSIFCIIILSMARNLQNVIFLKMAYFTGRMSYPFYLAQYFSVLLAKYLYWQFLSNPHFRLYWWHGFLLNLILAYFLVRFYELPIYRFLAWISKNYSQLTTKDSKLST